MRHMPGDTHTDGEVAWHYTDTNLAASNAIVLIAYTERPYCIAKMDTLSNPNAEADANFICAALNAVAGATQAFPQDDA